MIYLNDQDYEFISNITLNENYTGFLKQNEALSEKDYDSKKVSYIGPGYNISSFERGSFLYRIFEQLLDDCLQEAKELHRHLELPEYLEPDRYLSGIKVIRYEPGDFTQIHEDKDLFSITVYRNFNNDNVRHFDDNHGEYNGHRYHFGEILEKEGVREKCKHKVDPSEHVQKSMIYVAHPKPDVQFVDGTTTKDYVEGAFKKQKLVDNSN